MDTLGKIQDGEKEYLTVSEALVNDKRSGKIILLDLWFF